MRKTSFEGVASHRGAGRATGGCRSNRPSPPKSKPTRHSPRRGLADQTVAGVQAMAGALQRRGHQESAQLSRLATRPRSLGRPCNPAKLDQKRHRKHRKRTIPTANAISAITCILIFRNKLFCRCRSIEDARRGEGRGRDRRGLNRQGSFPTGARGRPAGS